MLFGTERLEQAGFSKSDVEDRFGEVKPAAQDIRAVLGNMDTMAWHLDRYEGVEPEGEENVKGGRVFMQMLETDAPYAIAFVGLRRMEREGHEDRFKAGLALMAAVDKNLVPVEAVVEMTAPDLVPKGAEMAGLRVVGMETGKPERIASRGKVEQDAVIPAVRSSEQGR